MKKLLPLLLLLLMVEMSYAQHKRCATMHQLERKMMNNPELRAKIQQSEILIQQDGNPSASRSTANIITIPVVVHVIWNLSVQNVSEAQILSQLKILNDDFRLLNADSLKNNHPYWPNTSDTEIEFCLASKDPNGNATTGITRTQTSVVEWNDNNSDDLKNSAAGGKSNWDPTRYLNLYVANLEDGVLGFASFPDELSISPELDGVVIRPEAFGSVGTAGTGGYNANDLGRTATHEVGHWLFLRHIWGDEPCGNDFVNDTPVAESENYNCPSFPHNANNNCGTGANGEMYMNYMDYVDDACMKMFSAGQKIRMRSAITQLRPGLLTQTICSNANGLDSKNATLDFSIYPNPSRDQFYLDFGTTIPSRITFVNILGIKVYELENEINTKFEFNSSNELPKGIYFVDVLIGNHTIKKKLIIE